MKNESIIQSSISTPIGELFLCASEKGLCGLFQEEQSFIWLNDQNSGSLAAGHLRHAQEELEEYFAQKRTSFSVALDLKGTEFQKKVWQQLIAIPYGQTASYKNIAERMGSPQACRAVGAANGKNPVFVIVPCHRVITADGKIGGFSAGLGVKKQLLQLENIALSGPLDSSQMSFLE